MLTKKALENIVGKGENAGNQHFLLLQCFVPLSKKKIRNHHLTLSSIYTHFNSLMKNALEHIVEKGEIAQNEQFHLFPQCFICTLYLKIV